MSNSLTERREALVRLLDQIHAYNASMGNQTTSGLRRLAHALGHHKRDAHLDVAWDSYTEEELRKALRQQERKPSQVSHSIKAWKLVVTRLVPDDKRDELLTPGREPHTITIVIDPPEGSSETDDSSRQRWAPSLRVQMNTDNRANSQDNRGAFRESAKSSEFRWGWQEIKEGSSLAFAGLYNLTSAAVRRIFSRISS